MDLRLPRVIADLALAEEFQRLLDAKELPNRAVLARRFRLTRARVTQLMHLLTLHTGILAYVKALPAGTPQKLVTVRRLRTLAGFPPSKQLAMASQHVPGFAAFIKAKDPKHTA